MDPSNIPPQDGKFAAGGDSLTLADLCLLATYSTLKATSFMDLSTYKNLEAWEAKVIALVPNYEKVAVQLLYSLLGSRLKVVFPIHFTIPPRQTARELLASEPFTSLRWLPEGCPGPACIYHRCTNVL